jgi:hypothetical protein
MKKRLLLLGVMTMCLILLGSLSVPVIAQDDGMNFMGLTDGSIDVGYDIELTNSYSFTSWTPGDLTNAHLRYNLTSMKSPLDTYFNMGFFTGGDSSSPQPEFAINGTFEGSELFVKIVNDRTSIYDPTDRLLDWQALLTLGEDIEISVMFPPELEAAFWMELLPESYVIPAGSGTPPFPAVSSPTNFSDFLSLNDLARSYGQDGLPFVSPSIFYLDDLAAAYTFWGDSENVDKLFPPAEDAENNHTITVTPTQDSGFELLVEAEFFNSTTDHGNLSLYADWGTNGFLEYFDISLFPDMDESGTLDASEEIYFEFDLIENVNSVPVPASVGDSGEYLIDIDMWAEVDIENDTEEAFMNDMLAAITDSINELDGKKLLNYTIDSMDGLYYHIDGYLLNIEAFIMDRLGPIFGGEPAAGFGAEPLPPVEDYYMAFDEMDSKGHPFAINMFDATVYSNDTMFYEVYDGHWYWDDYLQQDVFEPLVAYDENTTRIDHHMPGVVYLYLFNQTDWHNSWDDLSTFEENLADAISSGLVVSEGSPEYIEIEHAEYDPYWVWNNWTDLVIQHIDNDSFVPGLPLYAVMQIEGLPGSGFTTYHPQNSIFQLLFMNRGPEEPYYDVGFGADEMPPQSSAQMLPINPSQFLPMPVRTPDWAEVGAPVVFVEGFVDQLAAIITSSDFITFLEDMAMMEDPGDSLSIDVFDFDLDWMVNATHAGITSYSELDMTQVDNDTGNLVITTADLAVMSEEHYLWAIDGAFDSAYSYSTAVVSFSTEDWPTEPEDTTTTETTTTTTDIEISPGFDIAFVFGSLIALPIFLRKRR